MGALMIANETTRRLQELPAPAAPVDLTDPELEVIEPARLLMPGCEHRELRCVEGITVAELVQGGTPAELWPLLRVFNHGVLVQDWEGLTLRRGDRLLIAVVPQGGGGKSKGILGAVLTIAVAVFAPWAAGTVFGLTTGTAAYAAATVAITMVGTMVISALVKPPSVSTADKVAGSPTSYSLTGQSNAARPYQSCYVLYGRHKIMPALAANPDVDNFGSTSTLTAVYDFGLGYVGVNDMRIGDVDIWQYSPALVLHQNSLMQNLQLYAHRIGYDQYAIALKQNDPVVVRTKPNSFQANMDIQFPKGIFQSAPAYGSLPFWADFAAFWREVGTTQWIEVPIDWYHGALAREYTAAVTYNIWFQLPGFSNGEVYYPWSSPARLRQLAAEWAAAQTGQVIYTQARPNPNFVFSYPNGPINEEDYFARYPEIVRAGWRAVGRSAQDHFESVGSREGRNPGVTVYINVFWLPYDPVYHPYTLHQLDMQQWPNDPLVGLWRFIESGSPIPEAPPLGAVPFQWALSPPSPPFQEAVYLQRYPDVAAWVAAGPGRSGWIHFTQYGAFEGRDPYPAPVAQRSVRLTAQWVGPYWMRIFFQFPHPGEYELQVVRTDVIQDGTDQLINQVSGGAITAQFNESTLALLRSYEHGLPIMPRIPHTMLEMRVQASDQLSGVVQNLSAICTSVLLVTNDGVNFWWAETRNPAWIALDIITSEKNPRPLARSQIDWPSWIALAQVCDTPRTWTANGMPFTAPRYTCDIVVQDFGTVKELVESVLSCCRASLVLTTAGLWGVLYDQAKTIPRQLITPANSWGFTGVRTFTAQPHALRVNFINRDNGWTKDEITVYWDGYHAGNATQFETLDTFGITDWPHAWAYARYMMAQGIQRSELFTLSMDVENLLVQRGDMVHVAHDVPRVGGYPARVVDVMQYPGLAQGQVYVPQAVFSITPHQYTLRMADGMIRTGAAEIYPATPPGWVDLDNVNGIAPDDLIVFGETERVSEPYLVQGIAAGQDLSAELTLCRYEPLVYDADIGALPPWEPGFGEDVINTTNLKVTNLAASQLLYYVNREPRVDVPLTWITQGSALSYHEVVLIMPSGLRQTLISKQVPQNFQWTVDALRERMFFDIPLQFEVTPVSAGGLRGLSAYVSIVLLPDRAAPAPVAMFGANVQKEHIDLFWQAPNEPDISHYVIRYTPDAETPNWEASQVLATISYPTDKTSAGARTGSYGIRVFDTSGNISPVVWRRTTVAELPDINVIEAVNDRDLVPPWPGIRSHTVVDGPLLMSEGAFGAIYPDGVYYFFKPLDLGDVYEVRISSKIQAYGQTEADFMVNWPVLSELASMAGTGYSDMWNAWLEVRTSNERRMMDEWVPDLTVVNPMSDGAEGSWSPWRPVQVGDFTAQLLQFRIILQSRNVGVRVVVNSGLVEVDMPDRFDAYSDIAVPAAGLDFVFPVAFRELEAVAITIDGSPDPLIADVSDKEPTGFHLRLRNAMTNAPASGQVDIQAKGYGRRRAESI